MIVPTPRGISAMPVPMAGASDGGDRNRHALLIDAQRGALRSEGRIKRHLIIRIGEVVGDGDGAGDQRREVLLAGGGELGMDVVRRDGAEQLATLARLHGDGDAGEGVSGASEANDAADEDDANPEPIGLLIVSGDEAAAGASTKARGAFMARVSRTTATCLIETSPWCR